MRSSCLSHNRGHNTSLTTDRKMFAKAGQAFKALRSSRTLLVHTESLICEIPVKSHLTVIGGDLRNLTLHRPRKLEGVVQIHHADFLPQLPFLSIFDC